MIFHDLGITRIYVTSMFEYSNNAIWKSGKYVFIHLFSVFDTIIIVPETNAIVDVVIETT